MEERKITPIQRHEARTLVIFLFYMMLWAIVSIIYELVMEYIFHAPDWLHNQVVFTPLFLMLYFQYKYQFRYGWMENFIEGKKKYPQLKVWFAEINGR